MTEEKMVEAVESALNPEEFDVISYLQNQPVAKDTEDIYTNVPASKKLDELVDKRRVYIAELREAEKRSGSSSLSISDADEDTEYDDEINELVGELEKTKLVFHLKSVAPALEKAIKKNYAAKADKDASPEERTAYEEKMYADILSRAIDYVETGSGQRDPKAWTPERLQTLQENLYEAQSNKLLTALSQMVYVGEIFDGSLTADF